MASQGSHKGNLSVAAQRHLSTQDWALKMGLSNCLPDSPGQGEDWGRPGRVNSTVPGGTDNFIQLPSSEELQVHLCTQVLDVRTPESPWIQEWVGWCAWRVQRKREARGTGRGQTYSP